MDVAEDLVLPIDGTYGLCGFQKSPFPGSIFVKERYKFLITMAKLGDVLENLF